MDYVGHIIRPPSESNSIILQVTVGCSHNKCTFCGAYKEKLFTIKDESTIRADINFAAQYCRRQKRLFLVDGDALIIPFVRLKAILEEINRKLPWVNRISTYGSAKSIRTKTVEQLQELKALGLHRVYLGLESGSDLVLSSVCKGETSDSMIEVAKTVRDAGLFLSVTVLLGLAGREFSKEHAIETANTLSAMRPKQVAALTLMILENTELGVQHAGNRFHLPSPDEMLSELRLLVENIEVPTQFHANHASNYLPIMGRLPRDKEKIISLIDQARKGETQIVPEGMRRL